MLKYINLFYSVTQNVSYLAVIFFRTMLLCSTLLVPHERKTLDACANEGGGTDFLGELTMYDSLYDLSLVAEINNKNARKHRHDV